MSRFFFQIELPDIDKEKGLSPKQTALIEASDGIIFVYNASSAVSFPDIIFNRFPLVLSRLKTDGGNFVVLIRIFEKI